MTKANDLASLLDANGDVVSSALDNVPAAPTPSLSSLGIPNHDDITVDGSGNVGIGGSPSAHLQVNGSFGNNTAILTDRNGTAAVTVDQYGATTFANQVIASNLATNSSGTAMTFSQGASERMRIDSSGNLLVGTTNTDPAFNNVTGQSMAPTGQLQVTRDGGTAALFNRKTSDGDIVQFRKDGGTVGSIGVESGKLVVNSQGSNLVFAVGGTTELNLDGTQFYPQTDGGLDLGHPSVKWKDLRLSGGVYLGGTGSANYLDDYEEGTFTAFIYGTTSGTGVNVTTTADYIKVGNHCTISAYFSNANLSSMSGSVKVGGLPFTSTSSPFALYTGSLVCYGFSFSGFLTSYISSGQTALDILDSVSNSSWQGLPIPASTGKYMIIGCTYRTA